MLITWLAATAAHRAARQGSAQVTAVAMECAGERHDRAARAGRTGEVTQVGRTGGGNDFGSGGAVRRNHRCRATP